jgi:hypothetical protein
MTSVFDTPEQKPSIEEQARALRAANRRKANAEAKRLASGPKMPQRKVRQCAYVHGVTLERCGNAWYLDEARSDKLFCTRQHKELSKGQRQTTDRQDAEREAHEAVSVVGDDWEDAEAWEPSEETKSQPWWR